MKPPSTWERIFFCLDSKGKVKKTNQSTTTLNGPLCFGGDVIARDIQIGTPEPGDWLVIRDCGAYTTSMWSRHCSRGIPGVAGFLDGQISWLRLVARRRSQVVSRRPLGFSPAVHSGKTPTSLPTLWPFRLAIFRQPYPRHHAHCRRFVPLHC